MNLTVEAAVADLHPVVQDAAIHVKYLVAILAVPIWLTYLLLAKQAVKEHATADARVDALVIANMEVDKLIDYADSCMPICIVNFNLFFYGQRYKGKTICVARK